MSLRRCRVMTLPSAETSPFSTVGTSVTRRGKAFRFWSNTHGGLFQSVIKIDEKYWFEYMPKFMVSMSCTKAIFNDFAVCAWAGESMSGNANKAMNNVNRD